MALRRLHLGSALDGPSNLPLGSVPKYVFGSLPLGSSLDGLGGLPIGLALNGYGSLSIDSALTATAACHLIRGAGRPWQLPHGTALNG